MGLQNHSHARLVPVLFQASSGPELGCVMVLVSLSDSDPERLSQTVANISDLFQTHIEARQLLVVRGQLGGPPPLGTLRPEDLPSSCEAELESMGLQRHNRAMEPAHTLHQAFSEKPCPVSVTELAMVIKVTSCHTPCSDFRLLLRVHLCCLPPRL